MFLVSRWYTSISDGLVFLSKVNVKFLILFVFDNRKVYSVDGVLPSNKQINKQLAIFWYYLKDRSMITIENSQRPWLHELNNWWGCKPLIPHATSLPHHFLLHLNQVWWEITRVVEVGIWDLEPTRADWNAKSACSSIYVIFFGS